MKDRTPSSPRWEPPGLQPNDNVPELLDDAQIFRSWGDDRVDGSDDDDTARVPAITSLPEGMEVIEHTVGRAVGQWVLMVRCQCGRRWFEVEAFDTATCPRCGMLVFLDVQQDEG